MTAKHDPTMPLTALKLGGDTFHLVYDLDAIAEAEDLTGRSLLLGLQQRDLRQPSINLVRAMLYAGLRRHQSQMTFEDAKELVTRKSMSPIWEAVVTAYGEFCAEPEEGEPANPQNAPEAMGDSGATSGATPASTSA